MANKEILIIYQDCFACGSPENWSEKAKKTFEACEKAGITPRKVSCFSQEGQAHAMAAIQAGVTTTPFFTDGKSYAESIEDLVQAESKPQAAKKPAKKTKKATKESENGTDSAN